MKKLKLIALISGLLAGSHAVNAQIQQGAQEIGFNASLTHFDPDVGDSDTSLTTQLRYGYFFTDQLALSGQWLGLFGDDFDFHFIGIGADYYFPMEMATPYIGASGLIRIFSNGETDTNFLPEARVGLKQYIAENAAIDYRLSYGFHSDFDVVTASVGVSLFWN